MATRTRDTRGPDVVAAETLRDSAGRVVDDAYVNAAIEDAIQHLRAVDAHPCPIRRVGRSCECPPFGYDGASDNNGDSIAACLTY